MNRILCCALLVAACAARAPQTRTSGVTIAGDSRSVGVLESEPRDVDQHLGRVFVFADSEEEAIAHLIQIADEMGANVIYDVDSASSAEGLLRAELTESRVAQIASAPRKVAQGPGMWSARAAIMR